MRVPLTSNEVTSVCRDINMKRLVAIFTLTAIYGIASSLGVALRRYRRRRRGPGPLLLIGTFFNPNWVWAHVAPIAQSGAMEVLLLTDEPIPDMLHLRCVCPPRWLQYGLTRAGAKFVWSLWIGLRYRPSICMGYHVFPAGAIALMSASICGARAAYQLTSGPLEIKGGGWQAENALLVALGRPNESVEKAALFMTRQFECLVVRGSEAFQFLRTHGCKERIETITGSVTLPLSVSDFDARDIDLLFIGRLTEYKRPDRFIHIVRVLISRGLEVRAVMLGDGPDRPELEAAIAAAALQRHIELVGQRSDVESFQRRAKLIVLTSRWEGVSIAMLEGMACGATPIVSDVGDLRDFVDETTGACLNEHDLGSFADAIETLLTNRAIWASRSCASRRRVEQASSKQVVIGQWAKLLHELEQLTLRSGDV